LQEFLDAIKQRFSITNIKITASLKKKGKIHHEALDIYNEVKIITSNDSIFALWSEIIASHNQGELHNPKTNSLKKFKENKS
jgi:hypothetical protein